MYATYQVIYCSLYFVTLQVLNKLVYLFTVNTENRKLVIQKLLMISKFN